MIQGAKTEELLGRADALLRLGKSAEAERLCRAAIAIDRNNPRALYMLGVALSGLGNAMEAIDVLKSAIALVPDVPEPSLQLVTVLRKTGRVSEAATRCKAYIARNPLFAPMHSMLAICLAERRQYSDAVKSFRDAIDLQPENARYRSHLANALRLSGKKEQALKTLQDAIAIDSKSPDVYVAIGEISAELGRFDEAITAFKQALELRPSEPWPYLGIVTTKTITAEDEPLIRQMRSLLNQKGLSNMERRTLHYALSKASDDLARHKDALDHMDEAVRISDPEPDDAKARQADIDKSIQTFTRSFFQNHRGLATESNWPVLIVGAPRSGTTLLDQILTSHPQIGRAGELLYWLDHSVEARNAINAQDPRAKDLSKGYLDLLRERSPETSLVIDKMPMNYAALGIIHTLLPEAKLIHCRRDSVDTCLSLYLNSHSISPKPFGDTREQIVAGYKGYLRLMEHWRMTLPKDIFIEVDYEQLVANREAEVRRLLDFLGLEWDDSCLRHELNPIQVSTPSRWQVRQPLYKTSVERWRRYEPWLGEFKELLG